WPYTTLFRSVPEREHLPEQAVHGRAHPLLDAPLGVADDLASELLLEPVAVAEETQLRDADGVVEELDAAALHLQEDVVHVGEVAPGALAERRLLLGDVGLQCCQPRGVGVEHGAALGEAFVEASEEAVGGVEGGGELEGEAGVAGEGVAEEGLEGGEAARAPGVVVA